MSSFKEENPKLLFVDLVVLHRNLDKNDKANKVYISKRGTTLWQKKTDRKQRSAAA